MTLEELFSGNHLTRSWDCSVTGNMGNCDQGNEDGKCGNAGSNATDCPGQRPNAPC